MKFEPDVHTPIRLAALVALFYDPAPWTDDRKRTWRVLSGQEDATTKVLGDFARNVLVGSGLREMAEDVGADPGRTVTPLQLATTIDHLLAWAGEPPAHTKLITPEDRDAIEAVREGGWRIAGVGKIPECEHPMVGDRDPAPSGPFPPLPPLPGSPAKPSESPRIRHLKRGTSYLNQGHAGVQTSRPIQEGDTVVVYQSDHGVRTARLVSEMDDGRFEAIPMKWVDHPEPSQSHKVFQFYVSDEPPVDGGLPPIFGQIERFSEHGPTYANTAHHRSGPMSSPAFKFGTPAPTPEQVEEGDRLAREWVERMARAQVTGEDADQPRTVPS